MTAFPPYLDLEACLADTARQNAAGAVKTWQDLDRYEQVIARVRPSLIVECGTFSGRSALWFARFAPVLTCDVNPIATVEPATPPQWAQSPHHILQVDDLSSSLHMQLAVKMMAGLYPGPMLLVLDSDHSTATVAAELDLYADRAAYVVVEDTLLRWMPDEERCHYDGDPLAAAEAFLCTHDEWEVDVEIESMSKSTQHPRGWLRRVDRG